MIIHRLASISHSAARLFGRSRREQAGFSIIEVMIAAMLLVIGALAVFKLVDAAARSSYRAEQSQVVNNLLQSELERVKAADRDLMAVDLSDPYACLSSAEEFTSEFGTNGDGEDTFAGQTVVEPDADAESFDVCETVTTGESDVTVNVYRIVTWFDPADEPSSPQKCTKPDDPGDAYSADFCGMKRITIGAKPETTASGGVRQYRQIKADVVAFEPDGETG